MPAHCTHDHVGVKLLGDGSLLSELDLKGNSYVDKLAKEAAREGRVPLAQCLILLDDVFGVEEAVDFESEFGR